MIKPISIAGVPVMPFESIDHVLENVFNANGAVIPGAAIAINPEKILKSIEDQAVKNVLLDATIPYADGIGAVKAMEKKSNQKLSRIPGVELWYEIVKKAGKTANSVFIVGARPEVSEQTAQILVERHNVTLAGRSDGYFQDEKQLIENIVASKAKVVIVALGSPKQELFIKECRKRHPDAFYMGVGGSFDVLVGRVERAPDFWCKLNLEWFYRLMCEPTRIKRQIKLAKFLYLHLTNKL